MRRLLLTTAAMLLVAAAGAEPAWSAIRFERLTSMGGEFSMPAVTDGARWAAMSHGDDRAQVTDHLTGRRWAVPCRAIAMGGGYLLCDSPESREPVIYSLERRAAEPVAPGVLDADHPEGGRLFADVGRHWLQATSSGSSWVWLNWRTGESRDRPSLGPRDILDLDARDLTTTLCQPLQRPRRYSLRSLGAYFQFDAPYGLGDRPNPRTGQDFVLDVQRCGQKARRLSECTAGCGDFNLGGNRVSWTEGLRAYYYDLARRHKHSLALPRSQGRVRGARIAHTRKRLYISIFRRVESRAVYEVWVARLPT